MRMLAAPLAAVACACALAAPAASMPEPWLDGPRTGLPAPKPSWAQKEIETVVAAGLLAPSAAEARPDDPVTHGELAEALVALGKPAALPKDPDRPVTVRELDAKLVTALGLDRQAKTIRAATVAAGLRPPAWLGTETVARLLGLRVNHPQGQEELELQLTDPATRAEAAYSLARMLALQQWDLDRIKQRAASFSLPPLAGLQLQVLDRALAFVGSPYVWAGTSELRQQLYYGNAPGGFDCSGFVWRVYKTHPFPEAPQLAATLVGRSTYVMSGETVPQARIVLKALQPGDVIFFGDRGAKSKPTQIGHAGIYVGNGWFVHSSRNGVTLQPLEGWYSERFAWGRRLLAEAGLAA